MSQTRVGYRQLNAACVCRPHHAPFFGSTKWMLPMVTVRVFSDDDYDVGDELSVDVFTGGGVTLPFLGRVEWVESVDDGRAHWQVGLRLSPKSEFNRTQFEHVLG